MDKKRKALETIALGYSQGIVYSDILIKACDSYKSQIDFVNSEDYDIMVSKSFFDFINGVDTDDIISKAIVPGQTKYFNGVLYVYSATKNGSKTDYGWHVARKSKVGKSSKMDDVSVQSSESSINQMFPTDIKSVSIVKAVGGSTGAQLAMDVKGNEYIMKRATKVPEEHVRSEYLANMLYSILGLKTPDFELYNADNKDITMLSRFIPGTRPPGSQDFAAMGKGFMIDVLLANYDVYKNDNCRIDAGGNVIRVDNGASLHFRAQGARKNPPFDGDVVKTYESMQKYNSALAQTLDKSDLIRQMEFIFRKKNDVINFLQESGESGLASILKSRIENLKPLRDKMLKQQRYDLAAQVAKVNKIPPRDLKPKNEMYASIPDSDYQDMMDELIESNPYLTKEGTISYKDRKHAGLELLSKICQKRGFDARPRVVTEDEFWKEAANSQRPIMFRGIAGDSNDTAKGYTDAFRYNDFCYYGTDCVWGQGIYAHSDDINQKWLDDVKKKNSALGGYCDRNTVPYNPADNVNLKSNRSNYKQSKPWYNADSYANHGAGGVLKMFWEKDANVVELDDLLNEIKSNPPSSKTNPIDKAKIDKLKSELDEIKKEWTDAEIDLQNIGDKIKKDVRKKFHYDEDAISDMYDDIDNTDWGNINAQGKLNYPSFDDFVLGKMSDWVTKNGGKVELGENKEYVIFRIGGERFGLARYSWDHNAIKRKSVSAKPYNYHATEFKTFIETNCIRRVDLAIKDAMKDANGIANKLKSKVDDLEQKHRDKLAEYNKATAVDMSNGSLYTILYNKLKSVGPRDSHNLEPIGLYAAMKGYDGIYVHNGNTGQNGFTIILNRSKIVTSVE